MVRDVICTALAPLEGATDFDGVRDFSAPFPVEVISRMLGVPASERQAIRERLDIGLHREPGEHETTPAGVQAMMENGAYLYQLVVEKRKRPADDMLSRLTQVTVDRRRRRETGLDDVEIAGFATCSAAPAPRR